MYFFRLPNVAFGNVGLEVATASRLKKIYRAGADILLLIFARQRWAGGCNRLAVEEDLRGSADTLLLILRGNVGLEVATASRLKKIYAAVRTPYCYLGRLVGV